MKKTIISVILSIFLVSITTLNNYSFASASSSVLMSNNILDTYKNISLAVGTSFVTSGLATSFSTKFSDILIEEKKKIAAEDFNKLSEEVKQQYNNNFEHYFYVNSLEYNRRVIDNMTYETFQSLSKGFEKVSKSTYDALLSTYKNIYSNASSIANQVKSKYGQIKDGILVSFNETASKVDELINQLKNTKVGLQVDRNFIHRHLDIEKTIDKSLSDKYSISGTLSETQLQDLSTLSYADLYYAFDTINNRIEFLVSVSDYYYSSIEKHFTPVSFLMPTEVFNDRSVKILAYSFGSSFSYSDSDSKYLVHIVDKFVVSSKRPALDTIYRSDEVYYAASSGYKLNDSGVYELYSGGATYVLPVQFATVVETPFSTKKDIETFRKNYVMNKYFIENKPVNFVLTLDGLQDLSNAKPLTQEIASTLPNIPTVNATDFPISAISTLPTDKAVEEENNKVAGLVPGNTVVNNNIKVDLNGFLKDLIAGLNQLLKSVFVPSDTFFETKINSIKTKLNQKLGANHFDTLNQFKNVGKFAFEDIYITLNGQRTKVFDFSFVRNNLSKIKNITDPIFYLVFLLFCYNEIYFIIRGVYPLKFNLDRGNN